MTVTLDVRDETPSAAAVREPILALRQVTIGAGFRPIIAIEHLDVYRGDVLGIVGRSGCGKTTMLSAIAGAAEPLEGAVSIDGAPRGRQWRTGHTARTLQSFPLLHWLTVRANLELACHIRGVSTDHVDEMLRQFAVDLLSDRYPRHLSGGERCRASLAQAVVARPALLLLDEPFTGLDTLTKEEISETLFQFARDHGVGVLLVTHDLEDAINYSNRVLVVGGMPVTRVIAEVDATVPDADRAIREALRRGGR